MTQPKYSWHARVVHFPTVSFGDEVNEWNKHDSFCPYFRMLLWKGIIVIPGTCLIIGGILGWYLSALAYFVMSGFDLTDAAGPGYGVWLIIHGVIVVGVSWATILLMLQKRAKAKKLIADTLVITQQEAGTYVEPEPKQPGFLSLWWDKFHHKICPKMEY